MKKSVLIIIICLIRVQTFATIVGQLNAVDRQISLLNDSTLRSIPEQWMTTYNTAHAMNNALGTSQVFEQNAKAMNSLYLNTLLNGSNILKESDEEAIETLAFTCPYTGGNAVFRARVLHGMKHFGIHYDDLEICNGQGVYKGGTTKLQHQLNQLNNNTNTISEIKRTINEDEVIVYPNPARNQVTIVCKEAKEIIITDLLGNVLLRNKLNDILVENNLQLKNFLSGLYFYKVLKADNTFYSGKLIIEY